MSSENHELGVLVKIKEQAKFSRDADKTAKDVERIGKAAQSSSRHLASGSAHLRQYSSGLGMLSTMASSTASATRNVGYLSTGLLGAASAGGYFGLKTASGLEQANISFKSLLGSQTAATAKMKEFKAFAYTTPFEFDGLVQTGQQLLAVGFSANEIIPVLKDVGNATAALGSGQFGIDRITYALGQMRQAGRVNSQDMRQLTDARVDAWGILGRASGKTMAQLRKDAEMGRIPGEWAVKTLLQGMGQIGGGNMMEEQSKTLGGRLSNFKDAIKGRLLEVNEDGTYGGVLGPMVKMLERNFPAATVIAEKGMRMLGRGVLWTTEGISSLARAYKSGGMKGMLGELGNLTGTGTMLWKIWQHLSKDAKNLASIFQGSLWPAAKNVAQVFGPVFMAGLLVLEGILQWMADNPTAASAIFTSLGIALVTYGTLSSILNIAGGFKRMGGAIWGVVEAYKAMAIWGAAGSAPMTGGVGTKPSGKGGAGSKAGLLGLAGRAGAWGAGIAGLGYLGYQFGKNIAGPVIENFGKIGQAPGFASGGVNSVRRVAMVGEQGPELVRLPGGSSVTSNRDLSAMLSSSGQPPIVFQRGAISISGTDVLHDRRVADILVQRIKTELARK